MKLKNQKNNIEERLRFLEKIDEFKNIKRHTSVKGRKENENDAEHSWRWQDSILQYLQAAFSDIFVISQGATRRLAV